MIFVIQAGSKPGEDGIMHDVVKIDLIDKTVDGAIKRAKKLIKKDFYRVSDIIEKEIC